MLSRVPKVVLLSFLLFFTAKALCEERPYTAKVIGVSDGDTITVMLEGRTLRVRLNGIDCPEEGQPYGSKAKMFTSALCFEEEVTVQPLGTDKYGRQLANITLSDGRVLNRELVSAGLAWWYEEYSKDEMLQKLQAQAKEAKRGLWKDPQAKPPWEWRHPQVTVDTEKEGETVLPKVTKPPVVAPASVTVHVTRTGAKYHRAGCRYLKSDIPMELKEAIKRGYTPCSVCCPPTLDSSRADTQVQDAAQLPPAPAVSPVAQPGDSGESVYVQGYYPKDGTYVRPHYSSAPNK